MDYERIHKVQTGVLSPSKLRMKLLGVHNRRIGGNSSSRASPSKTEDTEFAMNCLLDANASYADEGNIKEADGASTTCFSRTNSVRKLIYTGQEEQSCSFQNDCGSKGNDDANNAKIQDVFRDPSYQAQPGNASMVHPVRCGEEYNNDNGSSSTFEFHRGERILPSPTMGLFSRPFPSKWNDAEKWIISRQKAHPNSSRKTDMQNQLNRLMVSNCVRVAPETVVPEQRLPVLQPKKANLFRLSSHNVAEKVSFAPSSSLPTSKGATCNGEFIDIAHDCGSSSIPVNGLKDVNEVELPAAERPVCEEEGFSSIKSVCMRDMGTEMTPITSQEPSRIGTPLGAATPARSFNSSRESTPRRGSPTLSPTKAAPNDRSKLPENNMIGLSEQEFRIKTRREIVALGLKLGKTNIAEWASKDDIETASTSTKHVDSGTLEKAEFQARAAAWEEAEKSKHMASFTREEVKIKAWESHQRARYEAKLRKVEMQLEKMRAAAQEKMTRKLAMTKQQSEAKLAAAEIRKNHQAARIMMQADHIRKTGRKSSSLSLCCSGFF